MNKGTVLVLVLAVAVGAYVLGGVVKKGDGGDTSAATQNSEKTEAAKAGAAAPAAPADGVERYRVPLEGTVRGSATAKVSIVAFSDFQCPFCSRAEATIEQVVARYGDRVRLVYRDFPLDIHPNADRAAQAAECARSQGKYWEMNRAMFADASKLSEADLVETAGRIGLDADAFRKCLDSNASETPVRKDVEAGRSLGITGTPTFFINGIMIVGARELQVFTDVIDDELERAGR